MAKKKKDKDAAEDAGSDAKEAPAGEGAAEGEEGGEGSPKKGKKKLIFIAAGALVVILGVVGFLVMGGGGDEKKDKKGKEKGEHGGEAVVVDNKPVYYELPEFLVNLSTTGNRVSFLKMSVTLELKDQAAVAVLEAQKPRVIDTFNTYLRELRPADVQGSAGIYRLRDELMARINGTVEEGMVKDILFSEIIVQ